MRNLVKLFSLAAILLGFAACSKDGDEPSNGSTQPKLNVIFTKMTNCPIAYVEDCEVWENEIYYLGDLFLKYSPASNKWTQLRYPPQIPKTLFVYKNALFCFTQDKVYQYNKATDSWGDSSSIIVDFKKYEENFVTNMKVVADKLYAHDSYHDLYYNAIKRTWEPIAQTSFFDVDVVSIGQFGYYDYSSVLNKFDTDSNTRYYLKWSTPSYTWAKPYEFNMATNYNSSQVLFLNFEEMHDGNELHLGIYSPSINEIIHYYFYDFDTKNYPKIDIPIAFNRIANINNRYFVGPTNSQFYEMKISK